MSSPSSSSNMQKFRKLFKRKSSTTSNTTTTPTPASSPRTRKTSWSTFSSTSSTSSSSTSSSNTSAYFSATSSYPSSYTSISSPHFSSSPSTATIFAYSFSTALSDASDAVDSRNRMDGLGVRSNSSSPISSLEIRKTREFLGGRGEVGRGKGIGGREELNGNEIGDDWVCW